MIDNFFFNLYDLIKKFCLPADIPGLALEECLDACILDENCQSLNYRAASTAEEEESDVQALCRLFPFNRADNRTLPVLIQVKRKLGNFKLVAVVGIYQNLNLVIF